MPASSAAEVPRELIRDRRFQLGFRVLDPKPGKRVFCGVLQWSAFQGTPAWDLAQWNSKYTLATVKAERLPSGAARFANAGKAVVVGSADSRDADIVMAVNGRAEYGERARRKGEPWPHLLVAQRFQRPPSLSKVRKAVLHVSFRLRRAKLHKTPDYTPRLHAAQFAIFVSVQNLNRRSPGYGDFLYFGIPLYDSRWPVPRTFQQPDAHGKFIYTPPGDVYTTKTAHDGKWITVHRDLMPLIHEALNTAWRRGFLLDSRDLADYRIAAMNMGWEVPGILDVEMQVKGLSLTVFED